MADQPTRPDRATRDAEEDEAKAEHRPDRPPSNDEEEAAERAAEHADPEVAEHYGEMAERGVNQKGEGRID